MTALLVAGCATAPSDPVAKAAYDEANDPIEPFNRSMFTVNANLDRYLLRPIATAYRDAVPDALRVSLRDFLRNLRSPLILLHDLAQGEGDSAASTVERFLVNSTLGVAGFMDIAGEYFDVPYHDEDAGQTLAVWGVPEGPYLVLPLLGPSNARDAGGFLVDNLIDPVSLAMNVNGVGIASLARTSLTLLDQRSRLLTSLDDLERSSIDYYATIRSLYRQRRQKEIGNGRVSSNPDDPGIEAPMPTGGPSQITAPTSTPPVEPSDGDEQQGPSKASVIAMPPTAPFQQPDSVPAASQTPARDLRGAILVFADGSALLSNTNRHLLRQIAQASLTMGTHVLIVGHAQESTDALAPDAARYFNFEIAGNRADAVAQELTADGVPPERITIEASGDSGFSYAFRTPLNASERRTVEVVFRRIEPPHGNPD